MTRSKIILVLIFFTALALRFGISLYNREANDDHLEVISWIVDKQELPTKEDCWECFQPKLFYLLNAGIIRTLGLQDPVHRIISVQMFNFVLSFFLLLFLWRCIRIQNFPEGLKLLTFALFALNPCLTGINGQATNDTIAILTGVLAIYYADLFFRRFQIGAFVGLVVSVIIASIVKGSGLIIMVALLGIFMVKIVFAFRDKRSLLIKYCAVMILGYGLIVPFAGNYYQNYLKYGDPFKSNIDHKDPPPPFYKQTYVERPGLTSIVHGYFTLRIFDMVKTPYITNGQGYPTHRTSMWSQLYGRTFFMQFDQHPGSWSTLNPKILNVGRILLLLGLIPLALFISGLIVTSIGFIRGVFKNFQFIADDNRWIHLAFSTAALLFIIQYTYTYRDFSTMKSIFLFPVLPSFAVMIMEGYSLIKRTIVTRSIRVGIAALIIFSVYDILLLINQLKWLNEEIK